MSKSDESPKLNGNGSLVLKNGDCLEVAWEIEFLATGVGHGRLRGDEKYLNAAVEDGCAILHLAPNNTAAITIDDQNAGEASFTTFLVASIPTIFNSQSIVGSGSIEHARFFLEFSGNNGEGLKVILPATILREYLPVLQKTVPSESSISSPASVAWFPTQCEHGFDPMGPSVFLAFDHELPLGLDPKTAREIAKAMIAVADKADAAHRALKVGDGARVSDGIKN